MMECDDYVSLSDDDNVVEVSSSIASRTKSKPNNDSSAAVETIVIDEDGGEVSSNNQNYAAVFMRILQRLHKEDANLAYFLDMCLDLEYTSEMMTVLEQSVIKAYDQCDKDYKKSSQYLRAVNRATISLQEDPDHKYAHIKDLFTCLRTKIKKRVDLITLATNLKGKHTPGISSQSKDKSKSKNDNNESIVIDSDDEPTINLDGNSNDVVCLDDESEKENQRIECNAVNSHENVLISPVALQYASTQSSLVELQVLPIEYEQPSSAPNTSMEDCARIKFIESRIACIKRQITFLEQAEVTVDTDASPYVLCESYKAEVVKLYKELCNLTGSQPVKKRKVRLKVLDGHPPGPVKMLELFINNNIGEDGSPLFPDFCDVVKCVMVANVEDKLGWTKQQVMREANSLFTQCGRALQKKRQKREYRDLLARIKEEDRDPADTDPELRRRLEENRKTGIKKELDLIQRYAQLQDLPNRPKSGTMLEQFFATDQHISNPVNSSEPTIDQRDVTHLANLSTDHEQNEGVVFISNGNEDVVSIRNGNQDTESIQDRNIASIYNGNMTSIQKGNYPSNHGGNDVPMPHAKSEVTSKIDIETSKVSESILNSSESTIDQRDVTHPANISTDHEQNEDVMFIPNGNEDVASMRNESQDIKFIQDRNIASIYNGNMTSIQNGNDTLNHDGNDVPMPHAKSEVTSKIDIETSKASESILNSSEPTINQRDVTHPANISTDHEQNEDVVFIPNGNEDVASGYNGHIEIASTQNRNKAFYKDKIDIETSKSSESILNTPAEQSENRPIPNVSESADIFLSESSDIILRGSPDIIFSDEDSDFEPPEIPLSLKIEEKIIESESNLPETENNNQVDTIVKKEVKPEPMDILKMLEELGDDFTVSVFDIQDPFMVIEISSDSSEDEMELDDDDVECFS